MRFIEKKCLLIIKKGCTRNRIYRTNLEPYFTYKKVEIQEKYTEGKTLIEPSATIMVKNNETNDKFYRKVAFPRYTESVKFMSQS